MSEIKSCSRCLYTTAHPLGLIIDNEGICSGCRVHEEKDRLDWSVRWEKLEKLVKPYRNSNGSNYDCIVPVSGANDSYFILHIVKDRLKLNPLLVSYNNYFNTPLGIRNLANLRIKYNCDIVVQNVNPVSVKKIVKTTLRRFGSIYWPIHAGKSVFPVQTAVQYDIPLIIWGAHQGLEQVGMFSHENEVEMTRRSRKEHDLMGYEADDLLSVFDILSEQDIWQYRYPDDHELNQVGVKGIYLGNYVRWDPKAQHELMIEKYDYRTAKFSRTFDCYDHVDCFNYMGIHDQLKLYKHGYSKVADHATREIRHGRMTRSQGLNLVKNYEQQKVDYSSLFSQWLGVTKEAMLHLMNLHRNSKFWNETNPGQWEFNGLSVRENHVAEDAESGCKFTCNSEINEREESEYIVIGKGYP